MRSWARLMFAMGLRVAASVCYLVLVALLTTWQGADQAAKLVYILAIAYVSSNLGRYGADQQIAKSVVYFRNSCRLTAVNVITTQVLSALNIVPVIAIVIHRLATQTIENLDTAIGISGRPFAPRRCFNYFNSAKHACR